MIIPGQLVSIVTFPGVIVHELAHQVCCRICKIPVYDVAYFRVGNPAGYVVHEPTENPWKNLLVVVGPFLFNTILGMLITAPAYCVYKNWTELGNQNNFVSYMLSMCMLWLGISILMHAFPSTGDAQSLIQSVLKKKEVNLLVKIICAPVAGLIYLGAFGSVIWLDLGYALAMMAIIPRVIMRFFF